MVKKLKWNLILMSLLYVGLGIFLVMKPGTALNIVCYALGGVVLACAAVQLIRYFVVERGVFQSQLTLISGLICLALGVFLLLRSDIVVSILPIVFGLFVIFDAIGRVQNALDLRRCGYDSWKGFLLLPVLSVVLPVALVTQTYTFYEREPTTRTAEDVRVDMLSRALGETAADIDGMVTSHSETLTEQNGAAVLYLTVHAEEQIGTEAVDDSTIPEETAEMEQVP